MAYPALVATTEIRGRGTTSIWTKHSERGRKQAVLIASKPILHCQPSVPPITSLAAMTSAQQQATLAGANCEIAFDNLTRQLYATDASIYQIEPVGVAFPRHPRQASALIAAAAQAGVPVIPRGAGTGLTGGAIGDGLVIDFSRYNRQITDLDLDRGTVRVGPGVVLDHLNNFLRPHGFCFGPDVATSSRATLGGMIANNSSGAHTPVYGTTADH